MVDEVEDEGEAPGEVQVIEVVGGNADPRQAILATMDADIIANYEIYSYRHGAAVLRHAHPNELVELQQALRQFSITRHEIGIPGGNESVIPKRFARSLRPQGWVESRLRGDLSVKVDRYTETFRADGGSTKSKLPDTAPILIPGVIDGHKIDYVKNGVAADLEWNSKDQTFDRDLFAMRAFHEQGLISVGVIITRSSLLNPVFRHIPQLDRDGNPEVYNAGAMAGQPKMVFPKYGASTTWMGKLLYRLNAGRHGSCPIVVFGITHRQISDLTQNENQAVQTHLHDLGNIGAALPHFGG